MRRVLKDPLYGTLARERVCASCEGVEKAAPSGKAVEEKMALSLKIPLQK
jgi:hypothetical protein